MDQRRGENFTNNWLHTRKKEKEAFIKLLAVQT